MTPINHLLSSPYKHLTNSKLFFTNNNNIVLFYTLSYYIIYFVLEFHYNNFILFLYYYFKINKLTLSLYFLSHIHGKKWKVWIDRLYKRERLYFSFENVIWKDHLWNLCRWWFLIKWLSTSMNFSLLNWKLTFWVIFYLRPWRPLMNVFFCFFLTRWTIAITCFHMLFFCDNLTI